MPRVYVRKFDWDEAANLYQSGVSMPQVADRLGVSYQAVRRVLLKLGVQPRSLATSVRPDSLHCTSCHEWKPDRDFPNNRTKWNRARRYRHRQCRQCQTRAKRQWRAKNPTYERDYYQARRQAAA